MNRWVVVILGGVLSGLGSPGGQALAAATYRGVALPLWGQTADLDQLAASLDRMAAVGVNTVEVNVFWFQDYTYSTTITPDFNKYSASDQSVRAVLDAVHARGMQTMLKPLVNLRDTSHWRGEIVGGETWFTGHGGYGDFITHFADIACEKSAELFCVGTELAGTSGQEANWRSLISGVKARYSGQLTYAANHGGSAVTSENIAWWDALDYFGLDAYYPLTGKTNPTPAELQFAWSARADQIQAWRNGIDPAKPVLFTEVGYRSWDGANMAPWNSDERGDTHVDLQEQADCYEALLSQLWVRKNWLEGICWWNWEVDPDPTWEAPNWFTPQGKPAEAVIGRYYAPHPGDANRDGQVDYQDLGVLATNYNHGGQNWLTGDFNYDGTVDYEDLGILATNYRFGVPPGQGVPEPAPLGLLAACGLAVIARRR